MRGEDLYKYFKYPEQRELHEVGSFEHIQDIEVLQSPSEVDSFWFGWKSNGKWHQQRLPFGEISEDELKVLLVSMRLS